MPNKIFLEEFPLYRKFELKISENNLLVMKRPAINQECSFCGSLQTFRMPDNYLAGENKIIRPQRGNILLAAYICSGCEIEGRTFFIKIDPEGDWIMKIGQFPAWDISGNEQIEGALGDHADYYRRGLICESQGYGIGAFAYYRRIVEEIIDDLLNQVSDLLSGEELGSYKEALGQVAKSNSVSEKIEIAKDQLPPILRPGGVNPLATLHKVLSEGLHVESEDECLKYAMAIREVLIFLTSQLTASRSAGSVFTEQMKTLLGKKQKAKKSKQAVEGGS